MDLFIVVIFLFLFLLSAFFSGTEIALMSLASHQIKTFLKQNKLGSKSLYYIKSNNDRLLITILVGNNLVNVYTAALATQISITIASNSGMEQSLAIGISTGIITFLILLFGEIIPKSFATKNAARIALFVAFPYKVLMFLLFPVIKIIEVITNIFTGGASKTKISNDEIKSFIDMGKDTGSLETGEYERIKNTLKFNRITVEEIMVPRVKIEALSSKTTIKEAKAFYLSHTHSRIPIYKKTIDKIIGILTIRDILKGDNNKHLEDIKFKKAIKIPLNQPIDNLLETFKKYHRHMAIVMDEYGGVAGIITLEDIIEEVFGEIRDETDKEEEEIKKIKKDLYIIKSNVLMENILDKFNLDFKDVGLDKKIFTGEKISYVLTHKIERFPELEEVIRYKILGNKKKKEKKKMEFKILGIEDGKIGDIEVKIIEE